jgi:hypothetical protein
MNTAISGLSTVYMPIGESLDVIQSNNVWLGDLDCTTNNSGHHLLIPTATTGLQAANYTNIHNLSLSNLGTGASASIDTNG